MFAGLIIGEEYGFHYDPETTHEHAIENKEFTSAKQTNKCMVISLAVQDDGYVLLSL